MPAGQQVPTALINELFQIYSSREGYGLYPDVRRFFAELQEYRKSRPTKELKWPYKRVVVGIVTNSDDRATSILQSLGLDIAPRRFGTSAEENPEPSSPKDIEFVVQSYDVGYEKPDRRMFDAATTMLDQMLEAEQSKTTSEDFEKLYVGDEVEKDFDGARNAGWHTVLVDRSGVMETSQNFRYGRVNLRGPKPQKQVVMARTLLELGMWEPQSLKKVPRWWKYEEA